MQWVARQLCEEAFLHGSLDNMAAIVVDLRDFAAREFHDYYRHHHHQHHHHGTTAHEHEAEAEAAHEAALGGGVPAAVSGREEVEEGDGAFFDSHEGEGRFRRNVTVCMRRASGSGSGSTEGEEDKAGQGQGQEEEEERLPPAAESPVSPSKRALGGLLSRRPQKGRRSGEKRAQAGSGENGKGSGKEA